MTKKQLEQIKLLTTAFARCLTEAENKLEHIKTTEREYTQLKRRSMNCNLSAQKRSDALSRANSSHQTLVNWYNSDPFLRGKRAHSTLALQMALSKLHEELDMNRRLYVDRYKPRSIFQRIWGWIKGGLI